MKTLALALLCMSSAATAATSTGERLVPVSFRYNSHELRTDEGRKALLQRMNATTRSACRGNRSAAYPSPQSCKVDLEKQLIKAIGSPALVAEYQGEFVEMARNGL